jgi:ABC-type multidrug transport system ATPase subunit
MLQQNRGTVRSRRNRFLFVSHDLNSVLNLCDRAIVLDEGKMLCDEKPHPAVLAYSAWSANARHWKPLAMKIGPGGKLQSLKKAAQQNGANGNGSKLKACQSQSW